MVTKKKEKKEQDPVDLVYQIERLTKQVNALEEEASRAYDRGYQRGYKAGYREAEMNEIYLEDEDDEDDDKASN